MMIMWARARERERITKRQGPRFTKNFHSPPILLSLFLSVSVCLCLSLCDAQVKTAFIWNVYGFLGCVCVRMRFRGEFVSIQFSNKRLPQKLCLFACITKIVIVGPNSSFAGNDDPNSRHRSNVFCIQHNTTRTHSNKILLCIKYYDRPTFFSAPAPLALSLLGVVFIDCIKLTLNPMLPHLVREYLKHSLLLENSRTHEKKIRLKMRAEKKSIYIYNERAARMCFSFSLGDALHWSNSLWEFRTKLFCLEKSKKLGNFRWFWNAF